VRPSRACAAFLTVIVSLIQPATSVGSPPASSVARYCAILVSDSAIVLRSLWTRGVGAHRGEGSGWGHQLGGTTAISRALNLDGKTVRRYLRAATAEELLTETVRRERELDDHAAYLAGRWEQGCTNAVLLTTELREHGYRGSARTVRRLLQTWRDGAIKPTAVAAVAPKPREATGWIIRPAADRTDCEQTDLARILERCDSLRTVDELVSDFAGMLRQLQGQHLDTWITRARASAVARLAGFAAGLVKDYDAVRNGLTLPYSSGCRGQRLSIDSDQKADVRPGERRPPPAPRSPRRVAVTTADGQSRTSRQRQM
jgi:hypothetical protein